VKEAIAEAESGPKSHVRRPCEEMRLQEENLHGTHFRAGLLHELKGSRRTEVFAALTAGPDGDRRGVLS
jgi:hypothetical protein